MNAVKPSAGRSPQGRVSFRSEALQDYRYRRVEASAPAYASPRKLVLLWIATLLFGAAAAGVLRHLSLLLDRGV